MHCRRLIASCPYPLDASNIPTVFVPTKNVSKQMMERMGLGLCLEFFVQNTISYKWYVDNGLKYLRWMAEIPGEVEVSILGVYR